MAQQWLTGNKPTMDDASYAVKRERQQP
jgi:hypothetical protein